MNMIPRALSTRFFKNRRLFVLRRTCKPNNKYYATKSQDVETVDKPIEYTKSPASRWQASSSRMGTDSNRLWYEPIVVLVSIGVFLIYFCVLREESDVDKEFDKSLYDRIKGLEEKQLLIALEYNRAHGLETKMLEERLNEIVNNKK